MGIELKPCPFCGGQAEMYYPFHIIGKPGVSAMYRGGVRCRCGTESAATTPPDGAIATWNTRATKSDPVNIPDYLAGGTRYKVTFDNRQSDARIYGLPKEFNGHWVALVDATDNRHMLAAQQSEAQQPGQALTDFDIVTMANRIIDYSFICDGGGPTELASDEARQAGLIEFARAIEARLSR